MTATTVRERGIIFTEENIRAIIEGRKTQTRRVIKPQPSFGGYPEAVRIVAERNGVIGWWKAGGITAKQLLQHSRYRVGDLLWVKERIYIDLIPYDADPLPKQRPGGIDDCLYYRADGDCCKQIPECACAEIGKPKWRSARFMPKWAARLWLEIIDVRVERVQEISEEDAIAEGCEKHYCSPEDTASCESGTPERALAERLEGGFLTAKFDFQNRWDRINRKTYPWESNPWVARVVFKRIERGQA